MKLHKELNTTQMKKVSVILFIATGIAMAGCNDVKREQGSIYMPDMAYSRAFETYSSRDSILFTTDNAHTDDKIFYNNNLKNCKTNYGRPQQKKYEQGPKLFFLIRRH